MLHFAPTLLAEEEFLTEADSFSTYDLDGQAQTLPLPAHALAFTFCQTPIVYVQGETAQVEVKWNDGRVVRNPGSCLDVASTREILDRSGQVRTVQITVKRERDHE